MKTAGIFFKSTFFHSVFILFLCHFTNLYSGGFYDKRCSNCSLLSVTLTHVLTQTTDKISDMANPQIRESQRQRTK